MDSLVGYGSDDENESERYTGHQYSGPSSAGSARRRDDDTNYDEVNMELSEDSQAESEPELPPVERAPRQPRDDRRSSNDSRGRVSDHDRRERRRDSPPKRPDRDRDRERDRRSPRRDDRPDRHRSERAERGRDAGGSRRGPDRHDERSSDSRSSDSKVPALMDLKPFGGEPPVYSKDARDAVSPRFTERGDRGDRRERDKGRERDRERHGRRSEERRSGSKHRERDRSRSRGAAFPPPPAAASSSSERRGSPPSTSGDYRPSSYKVNKKLEVMEKMGLQIKTPDGSMATAQQLRAAASEAPAPCGAGAPSFYNSGAMSSAKILDQVQKRKLLWSNKNKSEAEEASKWSGTRFAQDNDGRQVSKFMRLMGIKEPEKVKPEPDKAVDPIKKQEELFQAMQQQYEVARATTHTMRGVGLGFQRGQY